MTYRYDLSKKNVIIKNQFSLKKMKYIFIFIVIHCLSATCEGQVFSKKIKKIIALDSLEQYEEALQVAAVAWADAKDDTAQQIEILKLSAAIYDNQDDYIRMDSISSSAMQLLERSNKRAYSSDYFYFIWKKTGALSHINQAAAFAFLQENTKDWTLQGFDKVCYESAMAGIYYEQGNRDSAKLHYQIALQMAIEQHIENKYIAYLHLNFAYLEIDFDLAEKHYLQGIALAKRYLWQSSSNFQDFYHKIANAYSEQNKLKQAFDYYQKALAPNFIDKPKVYCAALESVITTYCNQTDDLDSMMHYIHRLDTFLLHSKDKALQKQKSYIVPQYEANLAIELGEYQTAIVYYKAQMAKIDTTNEDGKESFPFLCEEIGAAYFKIKDYEKAIFYSEQALRSLRKDEDVASKITVLNHLAKYQRARQNNVAQSEYASQAMALSAQQYGENDLTHQMNLGDWGISLLASGKYKEAKHCFQLAIPATQALWGMYHERAITYQTERLKAHCLLAEKDSVSLAANDLYSTLSGSYAQQLPILSERTRKTFVEKNEIFSHQLHSTISAFSDQAANRETAYNLALLTKNIVFNYTQQWKKSLENTSNTTHKTLYHNWLSHKNILATGESLDKKTSDSLTTHTENLERKLAMAAPAFFKSNQQVKVQQIQAKLKKGEAAIEFVHFNYYNSKGKTDSVLYFALILREGNIAPIYVPLFDESALECIVQNPDYAYAKQATATYNKIWKPLETHLQGVEKIYYALSGKLELVSFDAIRYAPGKTLHNRYVGGFHRLSSTRDLAFDFEVKPLIVNEKTSCLFLGNAAFGPQSEQSQSTIMGVPSAKKCGMRADSNSTTCGFKQLSTAAANYNNIDALTVGKKLRNFNRSGTAANEIYFKERVSDNLSPDFILFYTHGYFKEKPTYKVNEKWLVKDNPLFRSGLALAGANAAWCGQKTKGDDNLLTAYEISNMDLSNTKLVVLAACQSGVGDLQGSEGVAGLQRAFKMAGAKTILVALWDVEAPFADFFLTHFYEKILNGISPKAAFVATQNEVIALDKYNPNIWGAFVLVE
jgi:CHAT domain-containing protein/tetratricopeptide (TPR) repeat protein